MNNVQNIFDLPVSSATRESSARIMESLCSGTFREQYLTNSAKPFAEKQAVYLSAYTRCVCSRNHSYILECRGEVE